MQLSNNDVLNGLFSIQVIYSPTKIASYKMKSGNNGIVEYTLLNSNKALLKFNGAVCPKGKCEKSIKYYWIAGRNFQDVYTQGVCPYNYFLLTDITSVAPLKFTEIVT